MDEVYIADTVDELKDRVAFLGAIVMAFTAAAKTNEAISNPDEWGGMWYLINDLEKLVQKLEKACTAS